MAVLSGFGCIVVLGGSLAAMDSAWNQQDEINSIDKKVEFSLSTFNDELRLTTIQTHDYAYDSAQRTVAKIEAINEPDELQRRELSIARSEMDRILGILEKLRENN